MVEERYKVSLRMFAKPLPLLTNKQADCLTYIFRFFVTHRDYPTHREIAEAMSVHSTNVLPYLRPLINKGYIKRNNSAKRNIRLTGQAWRKLKLMGLIDGTSVRD
jgi:DNA-binding MarR family transcriptional regulator